MMESGNIIIYVTTTTHPNGFEGRVGKTFESVFGVNLRPVVPVVPSFGNISLYYNAAEDQIDYSSLVFANGIESPYVEWDDAEDSPRLNLAAISVLGVPTAGRITQADLDAQVERHHHTVVGPALLQRQRQFRRHDHRKSGGELAGLPFPIDPDRQPTLHFAVQNGNQHGSADQHRTGAATGVFTPSSAGYMNLLVTSADLAGVTGIQINQ